MGIEKISTVTMRQKVYDQLRSNFLNAELLPGEFIRLRGLAERFSVSLLPVREAVWQLESEKILVVESNKSIQVKPYLYIHAVKGKDLAPAVTHHQEMFNGFAEGDSDKAIAALWQDLNGAAAVILAHL